MVDIWGFCFVFLAFVCFCTPLLRWCVTRSCLSLRCAIYVTDVMMIKNILVKSKGGKKVKLSAGWKWYNSSIKWKIRHRRELRKFLQSRIACVYVYFIRLFGLVKACIEIGLVVLLVLRCVWLKGKNGGWKFHICVSYVILDMEFIHKIFTFIFIPQPNTSLMYFNSVAIDSISGL